MELEITDDDPRPKGYLYTSGQSDYYFIVWMSSNSNVATVDGDGKVTGRNAGTAHHHSHLRPTAKPCRLQGDP